MHSRDPDKDKGQFWDEFDRIIDGAGQGLADFSWFFFVQADCTRRSFICACVFEFATFWGDAEFCFSRFKKSARFFEAKFLKTADFEFAEFAELAGFSQVTCVGSAVFNNVRFDREAEFVKTQFSGPVDFRGANFRSGADFSDSAFLQTADFSHANFGSVANFIKASFSREAAFGEIVFQNEVDFSDVVFLLSATFMGAVFNGNAQFHKAAFYLDARFDKAKFSQGAFFWEARFEDLAYFTMTLFESHSNFEHTRFRGDVDFWLASFRGEAHFYETVFSRTANFASANFAGRVTFSETAFREDEEHEPGPIFTRTRFEKPDETLFYKAYLGQAQYCLCDVSKLAFTNVRWRTRPGNGKRMLFEEVALLDSPSSVDLGPYANSANERNYALIAELYQQLKKNYDAKCDYWTAGDFHYGELEMKRLSSPRRNRVRRWMHRNLGLVAWYKYASEYGESYTRPALCLAAVLLLFTLVYPITGLKPPQKQNKPPGAESSPAGTVPMAICYSTFSEFVQHDPVGMATGAGRFFGHSLMTSLGVAAFQRELEYQPVYPWGRVLQWAELLFTSTLIALFLLAVRRQFRR
jgi:uncharacterized protein YjbI with pentapeptide repeats